MPTSLHSLPYWDPPEELSDAELVTASRQLAREIGEADKRLRYLRRECLALEQQLEHLADDAETVAAEMRRRDTP